MVPAIREKAKNLDRFIATSMVSKHRFFVWLPKVQIPENLCVVVAKDDDMTFGIISSKYHVLWGLRLGTALEDRPRYTPSTTFETFPFPQGLEPNVDPAKFEDNPKAQKIAAAAKRLNELRENWLNPAGSIKRIPEVVEGYPDRIVPADKAAEKILKTRTLTKLYNDMPTWLQHAHKELDDAVAEAYGWPTDLSDDEILEKLFALNQERAKKE